MVDMADQSFMSADRSNRKRFATSRRNILRTTGAGVLGAIGLGVTNGTTAVAASAEEFEASVEPDEEDDFNYTYHLYGPRIPDNEERPLFVMPFVFPEPDPDDDIDAHIDDAQDWLDGYGRFLAFELEVPVLVPTIPWYDEEEPGADHCAPALDVETMELDDGSLERFDEQLLAAIDDATERLTDEWNAIADGVLLNGALYGGLFVNRFSALHPEQVRAVAAGGFSGTALLPETSANDTTLNYPLGVANIDEFVEEFNESGFADVDQFLYMGDEPFPDYVEDERVWNEEQAADVNEVYGDDLLSRFEYSESVYDEAGLEAQFEVYDDTSQWDALFAAESDILSHFRPHVGVPLLDSRERPDPGAESIDVEVTVPSDHDPVDVRVFHRDGTDLTEQVVTVQSGETVVEPVDLTRPLEAGDRLEIVLLEGGIEEPSEAIRSDSTDVDATHIEFVRSPSAGDNVVEFFSTISEEHLDEHSRSLEARVVDEEGNELSAEAEDLTISSRDRTIAIAESPVEGEDIEIALQPESDQYTPGEVLASESATVTADLRVEVADRPAVDDESIDVEVIVPSRYDPVDVRVFYRRETELTEQIVTVEPGETVVESIDLTEHLEAGDVLDVFLVEEGVTDPAERLAEDTTAVDATYIEFDQSPAAREDSVSYAATLSEEHRDEYEGIEVRAVDPESEVGLSDEPRRQGTWGSSFIRLTESLVAGEDIEVVLQAESDQYDPEGVIASDSTTVGAGVDIINRPAVDDDNIEAEVEVPSDGDPVDVRAFDLERSDLTEQIVTVQPGESVVETIELTEPLEAGDVLDILLLDEGVTDPDEWLAGDFTAVDATYVEFDQSPSAGDEAVELFTTISEEHLEEYDDLETRVVDTEDEEELSDEAAPINFWIDELTVDLTDSLSEGAEIKVVVQPEAEEYTPGEPLASETLTVVGDVDATASFTFTPDSPDVESEVTFDASASEPAENIEHYLWDVTDDGDIDETGIEATHTFSEPGDHEVTLILLDDQDDVLDETTETVNVREGCFIATAACGTPDHEQVQTLRAFRDSTLKGNTIGEQLVRLYYATSPPIADWVTQSPRRRSIVRSTVVRPAARVASVLGLDGSDT